MISESAELKALQRLKSWGGLSRLDAVLQDIRNRPNFFSIAPRVLRVEGVQDAGGRCYGWRRR